MSLTAGESFTEDAAGRSTFVLSTAHQPAGRLSSPPHGGGPVPAGSPRQTAPFPSEGSVHYHTRPAGLQG